MKQILNFSTVLLLIALAVISCKKDKHAENNADAENPQDSLDTVSAVVDSANMLSNIYPETHSATPVVKHETQVHIAKKQPSSDAAEPVPAGDPQPLDTDTGQLVVDEDNNLVSGLIVSTSETDTVEIHIVEVEPEFVEKKHSKRRIKGYGYINNREFTFDTPVTITDTEAGVSIDGDVLFTPIMEDVEVGDTSVSEEVTQSDHYLVKVKVRTNGDVVLKLRDLDTQVQEKMVFDKHGELLKDKKKHHK